MSGVREGAAARFYLPDFCAPGNVLAVVLIAELIAVLLALARFGLSSGFWPDLARTSLFLLWSGLGTAAVLCAARARLIGMDARRGSAIALGLILCITAVVTEAAWWLVSSAGWLFGLGQAGLGPSHLAFLARNLLVGAIAGGLALRYFYVSQQWKRNVEAEATARVRALQSRIRPHFLFNSMNTIAALTRSDPTRAEEAVTDLAELFRFSLRETRERIRLEEELDIARTYARIEGLRLGERLRVDWRLPPEFPADTPVPSLILQPLVENAVYHGIEPLTEGGTIAITAVRDGRFLEISVENPVAPGRQGRHGGSGIGLDNVGQRLQLTFPGEGSLRWEESPGRFRAILRFPAEEPA